LAPRRRGFGGLLGEEQSRGQPDDVDLAPRAAEELADGQHAQRCIDRRADQGVGHVVHAHAVPTPLVGGSVKQQSRAGYSRRVEGHARFGIQA